MSEKKKNLPARGWKIPAAVCALLLTVTLFLTQAGLIGIHVLTSRSLRCADRTTQLLFWINLLFNKY